MDLKTNALGKVNQARQALGARPLGELPKGNVTDAYSCPIARALKEWGAFVTPTRIQFDSQETVRTAASAWGVSPHSLCVDPPLEIFEFVLAFDHWELPDLMEEDNAT